MERHGNAGKYPRAQPGKPFLKAAYARQRYRATPATRNKAQAEPYSAFPSPVKLPTLKGECLQRETRPEKTVVTVKEQPEKRSFPFFPFTERGSGFCLAVDYLPPYSMAAANVFPGNEKGVLHREHSFSEKEMVKPVPSQPAKLSAWRTGNACGRRGDRAFYVPSCGNRGSED